MPVLQKSLKEAGFDNVFTEIPHSEILDLPNPNYLRLFCLKVSNNLFTFDNLHEFLLDNIGHYAFSRAQIEDFYLKEQEQKIAIKALERLNKSTKYNNCILGDELGDILLYIFLEKILGAPKLCSKLENTSNSSINANIGIHLLTLENSSPSYQMIFGKSNIVGDLKDAIDNAFSEIENFKNNFLDNSQFINNLIFTQSFNTKTIKILKENIIPDGKPKPPIDSAFGIFLGYKLGLDSINRSNFDFRITLKEKMKRDIKEHIEYIKEKIQNAKMKNHSFYFYILPFNDADIEKNSIMKRLLGLGDE